MAEADDGALGQEEQQSDPALEARAKEMGWAPKDKYKGDPERWVDAAAFVERAEIVLPLVKKRNELLESEVRELRANDAARDTELKSIRAALKAVEESQDEDLTERIQQTKADLEDQIAAASEAGEHRRVAKLTVELTELIAAERVKAARPAAEEPPAKTAVQVTPEHRAWAAENTDWLDKDQEKTRMAHAFGMAIAAEGLRGTSFYAELDKRLTRYYGNGAPAKGGDSKVADGRPAGGGGDGEGAPKAFTDLPREAKETCDRLAKKMVGEGKPHKDLKSWRASYVKQFTELEAR